MARTAHLLARLSTGATGAVDAALVKGLAVEFAKVPSYKSAYGNKHVIDDAPIGAAGSVFKRTQRREGVVAQFFKVSDVKNNNAVRDGLCAVLAAYERDGGSAAANDARVAGVDAILAADIGV